MRRLSYFLLAAIFGLLLTGKASAQRLDGTLRVTVTDGSQASIEDAKVTLTNEASGVSTDTRASSAGTYVFPNVHVGTYIITDEKDGFKKPIQKGFAVSSNQLAEAKNAVRSGSLCCV